jgi:hypothetical protein
MGTFTVTTPERLRLHAVELNGNGGRLKVRAAGLPLPPGDHDLAALAGYTETAHPLADPWRAANGGPQHVTLPSGGEALVLLLADGAGGHGLRVVRRAGESVLVADASAPSPVPPERLAEVAELVSAVGAQAAPDVVELTLSGDELDVLAELTGLSRFPGLEDGPALDADRRLRGRQALVARGLVELVHNRPRVDRRAAVALEAALRPIMTVHADHTAAGRREQRLFHLAATHAVEHAPGPLGTHRFTAFPTHELLDRLGGFVGIGGRPVVEGGAATLPTPTFDRLVTAAQSGRLDPAAAASGAPAEAAAFVAALGAGLSSANRLRVVRHARGRVTGGEVAWLDAGERGLWEVVRGTTGVRVTPFTPSDLLDRLRTLWR